MSIKSVAQSVPSVIVNNVGGGAGINGALDGVAAIAVGVYLAAVIIHGNASQLPGLVVGQKGYLEFVVSAGVLYGLSSWDAAQPLFGMLIVGAFIAVAVKLATDHGDIASKFSQFRQGQIDLFGLIVALFS